MRYYIAERSEQNLDKETLYYMLYHGHYTRDDRIYLCWQNKSNWHRNHRIMESFFYQFTLRAVWINACIVLYK